MLTGVPYVNDLARFARLTPDLDDPTVMADAWLDLIIPYARILMGSNAAANLERSGASYAIARARESR